MSTDLRVPERFLRFFVPNDIEKGGVKHRRAVLLVKTVFFLQSITFAVAVYYFFALDISIASQVVTAMMTGTVMFTVSLFVLRQTGSPSLAGNVMLLPQVGVMFYLTVAGGGLGAPAAFWLMVGGPVGLVYAGRGTGRLWLALGAALLVGLFVWELGGHQIEPLFPNEYVNRRYLVSTLGFGLFCYALIALSHNMQSWLVDSLREQKAEIRAVLQTAPDAIVGVDDDGRVRVANPAAGATFGCDADGMLGRPIEDFLPDLDLSSISRVEGAAGSQELEGRLAGGGVFPAQVSIGAHDSEHEGRILAVRDISDRKEREKKLRVARDQAVEASRAKSTFLANMSHELRTPLNAVLGYSEMLMEDADRAREGEPLDPDALQSDLDRINTAGDQLLALIDDILDLSKIEAGQVEAYIEDVDVETFFDELASTVRPLADKNGNALVVEVGAEVGEMGTDRQKLRQILFNLTNNACKFTESGEIRLAARRTDDRRSVEFTVSDTGIGMSDEEVDRVFEAFRQADDSTTREYGGTGLGLAIVEQFTELLDGEIDLETARGEGTTFRLTIPDASVEQQAEREAVESEVAETGVPDVDQGDGELVLVIDDDPDVRELLGRYLRGAGYRVAMAASGAEGLALAEELRPTVITLDIKMPGMSGWSVISELKSDAKLADIPVVLVTMLSKRARGLAVEAEDCLMKPVDRDQLLRALEKVDAKDTRPILVVEDDDETRDIMRRTLRKEGLDVVEATNGREGLEALESARPALVLLDLMMPEVDGFDFLAQLGSGDYPDVPVIVVTAKDLSAEDRSAIEQDVVEILRKGGYKRDELLEKVEMLVGRVTSG